MTQVYHTRWLLLLAVSATCWLNPAASEASCEQSRREVRTADRTPQDEPAISTANNFYNESAVEDGHTVRYSLSSSGAYTTILSPQASIRCGALSPALHAETPQSRHTRLQI
jgi:hypothetical protein